MNEARLGAMLPPYRPSNQLAAAAQRHADDVVTNGISDPDDVHLGSDGTHEQERVAEAGYPAWTWNSGQLIVDENMWFGHGTIDDAMAFFLGSEPHRNNLFSTRYREIGVGVAQDGQERSCYVLVFGVRPNVLPIFINDGAESTDDPQVAIHLTNEEARPEGEGADFMGRAIEVRISDQMDWEGLAWQPWEEYVSWNLPDVPGEHAVYVQFRDAAGRTAISQDVIILDQGAPPAPTASPKPTATPVPPTSTPEPTATPLPTPTPTATATPVPTLEPTAEHPASPLPSPTSLPAPESAELTATPFPTWTPLPTETHQESDGVSPPLAPLLTLQGLAVVLGLYLALRRARGGDPGEDEATR